MSALKQTQSILDTLRKQTTSIGISFSGGKESSVLLDLVTKTFPKVVCFYLYRIHPDETPQLTHFLKVAKIKYKVDILYYPHPDLYRMLKYAVLRPHKEQYDKLKLLTFKDIDNKFREQTNIEWILDGKKAADSQAIRSKLSYNIENGINWHSKKAYPLFHWKIKDVRSYIKIHKVPTAPQIPELNNHSLDQVIFDAPALNMIKKLYPIDYQTILKYFPFAEVELLRKEFYDQPVSKV